MEARRLALAGMAALAVSVMAVLALLGCGGERQAAKAQSKAGTDSSRPAPGPPAAAATELKPCLDHWNSPGNPTQRIRFATAARMAAAGTPLDNKALVLVYRGAPINDVGVGIGGVNLAPGDCMVVHPAAIMFAFTNGLWHQVGYTSAEPDLSPLPARAARSPNATVDLSSGIVTLSAGA